MAVANIISLLEAGEKNPELKAKINAVNSSEEIAKIGAEAGFEFTSAEAEEFRKNLIAASEKSENGELSDDDLEAAAGGSIGQDIGKGIDKGIDKSVEYYNKGVGIGKEGIDIGKSLIGKIQGW